MAFATAVKAGRAFVEIFADDSRLVRGLRRAQARLRAFAIGAQNIGRRLLAPAIAGGVLFGLTAKLFANFSDQMLKVKAISGATTEEFKLLTDQAKELGRTTSFTASQVASAMVELSRAGFRPNQILATTDSVLDLARATDTELAKATEIAVNTLKQFELGVDQSTRVADVLTMTVNSSTQVLEDLAEALKMAAPFAVEAGESMEDTATAIGIMADNGIKGTMAGTALARAYKNLSDEAKRARLSEMFGIDIGVEGNFRKMSDILGDIADKTKDVGNVARLAAFEELFGRGAAAAIKLGKAGAKFDDMSDKIKNSGGAAKEAAKVMDEGLGGAFRRMLSALEGVALAIADAFEKPLKKAAKFITQVSGNITEWIAENKKLVTILIFIPPALMAISLGLITFGLSAQGAAALVGILIGTLVALKVALLLLVSPIGIVGAVAVGVAIKIGAIGKASDALRNKFGFLKEDALKAFDGIKAALAAGDIKQAMKIMGLTLKVEWQRAISFFTEEWQEWKEFFLLVVNEIATSLANKFITAFADIRKGWVVMVNFFASSMDKFVTKSKGIWERYKSNVAKGFLVVAKSFGYDPEIALNAIKIINANLANFETEEARRLRERLEAADREADEKIKNINAVKDAQLEASGERKETEAERIAGEKRTALEQAETKLAAVIKEWSDAIKEAAQRRKAKEAKEREEKERKEREEKERKEREEKERKERERKQRERMGDLREAATVRGTFSPFALRGLVGANVATRTAKAAEKTATNTGLIIDKFGDLEKTIKLGTMVFAGH